MSHNVPCESYSDQAAVIDHLLDVATELRDRYDNTRRWRIITRHRLLNAWLQVVSRVHEIEVTAAIRRIDERRSTRQRDRSRQR